MFELVPEYYRLFKCRADRCKNTCCAGWEIQVSAKMHRKYRRIKGDLGKRLKDNICRKKDGYYFDTVEGRCPFLNDKGLCDIILEVGEDHLTDICKMHPRFVNEFQYHTEIGLGLCCEEAVSLILNHGSQLVLMLDGSSSNIQPEKFYGNYSGWERELFEIRDRLFFALRESSVNYDELKRELLQAVGVNTFDYDLNELLYFLLNLETMQSQWNMIINNTLNDALHKTTEPISESFYARRLLAYFIFRYVSIAKNNVQLREYLLFCIISTDVISIIINTYKCDAFGAENICRMYSQEIDYSTVNVDAIIGRFCKG